MGILCGFCGAHHWLAERVSSSSITRPIFESCCKKGDVSLPRLQQCPEPLRSLFVGNTTGSKLFRTKIREYNAALSFTSIKYTQDQRTANWGSGVQCFQIHGELYHLQGPLQPAENQHPQFAQLFLYDPAFAANSRSLQHPTLNSALLEQLTDMLHQCNPYIEIYRTAKERLEDMPEELGDLQVVLNPQLQLMMEAGADKRRYNLPTSNEVAMIIGDEYSEAGFRDIVLASRNSSERPHFTTINPNHGSYMPLHYVLLFPNGELGWHWALQLLDRAGNRKNTRLAQRAFYRYRLHPRFGESDHIFRSQRLWQQYLVDAWAVCDQNKLEWLRHNQSHLRADLYNGLADALLQNEEDSNAIGRRIILPSSFTGGDRFMQQLFQDSMAIVRHFGRPTLFITFTANPKWEEIVNALLPGQTAVDRPDLVARVFHMKQQELLRELKRDMIFGRFLGYVWTIEYQKRGLPHMHLLLFLHQDDHFMTAERIDKIVCAEFPDATIDPTGELTAIIQTAMIHGPCGISNPQAPCMAASCDRSIGKCSKRFPKEFQEETVVQEDGYPLYRRRNNGQSITVPQRNNSNHLTTFSFDNRWVVPYNPYLSWKYKAHINVEVCASVHAVKYIHKYIYKGSDRTTLQVAMQEDEIKRYLQGRYIGPTEAVWRLFEFAMHEETPPVIHLAIHLPGEQPIYFSEDANSEEIRERMETAKSTLMAYFQYNATHIDGRQYLYHEFPTYFVFNQKQREWTARKRGFAIGRIYHCNPFMGEKYYLRLLLTVVRGSQSFEDLRTVAGYVCPTFKEACKLLGLLEDDQEWHNCFLEAITFASGHSLRVLFVTALLFGTVADPQELWNQFRESICDDLSRRIEREGLQQIADSLEDRREPHIDFGLALIAQQLAESNKTLRDFDLPSPFIEWGNYCMNSLLLEQLQYNVEEQQDMHREFVSQLNTQQKACYDTIVESLHQPKTARFFLQGPAGTGKTFLYRCLCAFLRSQGKVVLCVASSGIAAQLLPGGRTSHSRFKIPLQLNESSTCAITCNSELADLLRSTSLIIWDEVPMQHRYCFEAVNRTLNDICQQDGDAFFGNIPIVFGGDFAQILPVVRRGNRAAIVNACLQRSELWSGLRQLRLTVNMRVQHGLANIEYAQFLGKMSYTPELQGQISLPTGIQCFHDIKAFCESVFPHTFLQNVDNNWTMFRDRTILAFRNDTVTMFNNLLIHQLSGELHVFNAVNTADINDSVMQMEELPAEYLQSIQHASLPPSRLCLKLGAPVILIRNLNPKEGLCNGTRMVVTRLGRNCIEVQILGGDFDGQRKLLPRITLSTTEDDFPFILSRKQFPIRLCFAMTVNKSQGQSFRTMGIDLRTPAFCHGQLYVALSRITDISGLKALLPENGPAKTQNIVYPEALLQ